MGPITIYNRECVLLTDSLMQNSIFKYSLEMVCFTNKSFNGRLFLDFIVKLMEVGNDKC